VHPPSSRWISCDTVPLGYRNWAQMDSEDELQVADVVEVEVEVERGTADIEGRVVRKGIREMRELVSFMVRRRCGNSE
jgi:hypothetical protein